MIEVKRKSILVTREGYIYLNEKWIKEGNSLSDAKRIRLNRTFDREQQDGYYQVEDGSIGYSSGRCWVSCSCDQMKKLLDDAGLEYIDGEDVISYEI